MNDDDLIIDNIIDNKKTKKKVDGKAKGDRTELHLCKLLGEHFGQEFSRALGSGSRWSQVSNLPEHAKKTLSGDICVPEGFKWVIECKGGYEDDMELATALEGDGLTQLDKFIDQVSRDADYTKRMPIICWKRNRKPWLACVRLADLSGLAFERSFAYRLYYREWFMISLDELLKKTEKSFWFEGGK